MNFDATLRMILYSNEKSVDEVKELMPELSMAMTNGDVTKFVKDNFDEKNYEKLLKNDTDGLAGQSGLDLIAYTLNETNKSKIEETYEKTYVPPYLVEMYKEINKAAYNRDRDTGYTYFLNEENLNDYYYFDNKNKYGEYQKLAKDYSNQSNKEHIKNLERYSEMMSFNNAYKLNNFSVQPSEERINDYLERHPELGLRQTKLHEESSLATGQEVQNAGVTGVVGLSEENLSLLDGINSNVSGIYGAMGLNNSQVGAEASGGYNSWTATTEMINNISNELSYNKLFQENSINNFIGIGRDFDSVFSELYTMKGQLVSLLKGQESAKDTLDTLSKRENNCLGWVTDLGSTSRIVSTV